MNQCFKHNCIKVLKNMLWTINGTTNYKYILALYLRVEFKMKSIVKD